MTFLQLYGEQLSKLLSSSDFSSLFTTARRQSEINDAAEWFVTQTECVTRDVTVALVDGDSSVNLRTAVADDDLLWFAKRGPEIRITRVADGFVTTSAGHDFVRTTVEALNRDVPNWRSDSDGTPRAWYTYKNGADQYLGFYPGLSLSAGYTAVLVLPYVARPATMAVDGDIPFTVNGGDADPTLTPWHDAIAMKAASELELYRKDTQRSGQLNQMAMGRVMDYLDKQRAPGGRSVQMPRRGSVRWAGQRAVKETVTV